MLFGRSDLSVGETFGLTDPLLRWEQAKLALGGDPYTPPSRWGLSSLKMFHPRLSVKTWLGWRPDDRLVPISNLFNRTQTPTEDGWSVRKTQVRDFRGGTTTYDSHNGTDFAIPPGTRVVTSAPGVVRRISNEFHRGGLKVVIDHGHGLITTSNHLGRTLVDVGQVLRRGDVIALSGYSGIDAVVSFPWSVPHVHFNTWLNGVPVDPFATDDEVSLWRNRNHPVPHTAGDDDEPIDAPQWDLDALDRVIEGCRDPELRQQLGATEPLVRRAVDTIFMRNYFPTRFRVDAPVYATAHRRRPMLDLPFSPKDYDGIRLL